MKLTAVYHVFPHNYWKHHLSDKLWKISKNALLYQDFHLHIMVMMPTEDDLCFVNEMITPYKDKITVHIAEENYVEYHAIKLLRDLAETTDGHTLYFHTKGCASNHTNDIRIFDWDDLMTYFAIVRWQDSVAKLNEGYSAVGVNFVPGGRQHFSGNFWWARNDYLRTLPKVTEPTSYRWAYEFYIGYNHNFKPFCPFRSPVNHYNLRCPPELYVGNNYSKNDLGEG